MYLNTDVFVVAIIFAQIFLTLSLITALLKIKTRWWVALVFGIIIARRIVLNEEIASKKFAGQFRGFPGFVALQRLSFWHTIVSTAPINRQWISICCFRLSRLPSPV